MSFDRRRMLIALGLIAAAGVVYVLFRRSGSPAASVGAQAPADTVPVSGSGAADGSGSGGASVTPDEQAALSALAGENQQLLANLLASQQGLYKLAGGPFGVGGGGSGTTDPGFISPGELPGTLPPPPSPSPSPAPVQALAASPYAGFSAQAVQGGTVYTPTTAAATAINAAPNALRTLGADVGPSAGTRTAATAKAAAAPRTFLATHAAPR